MKKRLLISSVLMSAVLACALGTGTYAWYEATTAGGAVSANTASATVATGDYAANVGSLAVNFTIVASQDVALTDPDTGLLSKVMVGTEALDAVDAKKVGTYTVTCAWADTYNEAARKEVANTYTVTLDTEGLVVLLSENNSAKEKEVDTITITYTVDSNGAVSVTDGGTGYFAVRAASTTAEEPADAHDNDKIKIVVA